VKLTRIDALRYGGLENACLSGFADGLTVVLGPNESGKSTLTTLARHVLYGFPDGRTKGRSYKPRSGERAGRLVFADTSGEWAIERTDGKKGGTLSVSALSGSERPGLLSELVGGVSEPSFQAIFAFGLDDLVIGRGGSGDDIVARLYAAGAGLAVNPMDVRSALDAKAAGLYSPRGSKPLVNALAAEIRTVQQEIRSLQAEAQSYAGEQARLRELSQRLAPLKARRDDLEAISRGIDRDILRLTDAAEQTATLRAELAEKDAAILDLQRSAEVIDVDERVVAVASELAAILEDVSGFRQRLDAITGAENSAEDADRRMAAGPAVPPEARDNAENRAAVEAWRDRLANLRADSDSASRAAAHAAAQAVGAESVAVEPAPAASTGNRSLPIAFAAVALAIGVVFAAAGLLVSPPQPLVSVLGAAVVVLGVVGLAIALFRRAPSPTTIPLTAEAARLRAAAEATRVLAEAATRVLDEAKSQWIAWLAENHLDLHGSDPAAVRQLLDEAKGRDALVAETTRYRAEAARERERAEEWVVRLVDVVRRYDDAAGQIPPPSAALELASRARTSLERARTAQDERAAIVREASAATLARQGIAERLNLALSATADVATKRGLDASDPLPELQALAFATAEERRELDETYEQLADEHSGLRARLDNDGRDDRMTRARQRLEGLQARAVTAADGYVVAALAVRLLDRARERFDRERQPEVVRIAGRVFSAMTLGRYKDIRIPLDAEIAVVTADDDLVPATLLSTGAAEQLYLALRVGLISSLGDLGKHLPVLMDDVAVNYDAERLAAASSAVAELSRVRQTVLFTCHAATAEVMLSAVPDAKLVTLDRCELRG
jgi:uncharacterized protein YhaN